MKSPVRFPRIVSPLMNTWMTKEPNEKEVRKVLFSFDVGNSLGPDGLSAEFYKTLWSELKDNIVDYVKKFFKGKPLLKVSNHTFITLIPKTPIVADLSEFRPIV